MGHLGDTPGNQEDSRDAQGSSSPIWVVSICNRCLVGFGAVVPEGAPPLVYPLRGGASCGLHGWVCGGQNITSWSVPAGIALPGSTCSPGMTR